MFKERKKKQYVYNFLTFSSVFYNGPTLVGPWSSCHHVRTSFTFQCPTRTHMSAIVCNSCRAMYYFCDNSDNSGSSDSRDNIDRSESSQEQTWVQDFAIIIVCISNRQYLGLSEPWVCAELTLVP